MVGCFDLGTIGSRNGYALEEREVTCLNLTGIIPALLLIAISVILFLH